MVWTHKFDLCIKLFLGAILIGSVIWLLDFFPDASSGLNITVYISVFIFIIILYYLFFRTLGSYLYCKYSLKMNIQFSEAKVLNSSLSPSLLLSQEWLTYHELLSLPEANRYSYALDMQENWLRGKKQAWLDEMFKFKNNSTWAKAVKVIIYIMLPVLLIISFLNLPPASYITSVYQSIFNSHSYAPVLNAFILFIPLIILLLFIDKK